MIRERERQCVYTCLFGNYEELQSQPIRKQSNLPFICFTDRADVAAEGWEIRVVEPIIPTDSARSARHPKTLPHRYLQEYDVSLYIDNTVRLLAPPEQVLAEMLPDQLIDACFLSHSDRDSLWDEFGAVQAAGLDTPERITETLDFVLAAAPRMLDQKPYISGMIARRHNREDLAAAMERWWLFICRYSRRDQLTLPMAIGQSTANIRIVNWDLRRTHLHQWPVETKRDRRDYFVPVLSAGRSKMTALLEENQKLKTRTAQLEAERLQADSVTLQLQESVTKHVTLALEAHSLLTETTSERDSEQHRADGLANSLATTLASRSWRVTRPLRWVVALFKAA